MKKIKSILVITSLLICSQTLLGARTCSTEFGIGDVVGNTNQYNLNSYPLPLKIIARSKIVMVDKETSSGVVQEPTRIRRDMYFKVTQKTVTGFVSSIFEIMSIVSKTE